MTMMNRMTVPACLCSCVLILTLTCCSGASSQKQKEPEREKMVGGCSSDTILIGLAIPDVPGSTGIGRIEVRSIKDRGEKVFRDAAIELTALIDSVGIDITGRSELIHITSGPCWPAFRVTIGAVLESPVLSEKLKELLLSTPVAGFTPYPERGPDYGTFFITAVRGSSDLWTVWYR
ncbi:MAG: hypothetical protein KAV42_05220 [Candidatus Krumholzibacteria bacterium]|nr:hypothetical protein [Candidatus Krumholzibacteria bacterium]